MGLMYAAITQCLKFSNDNIADYLMMMYDFGLALECTSVQFLTAVFVVLIGCIRVSCNKK